MKIINRITTKLKKPIIAAFVAGAGMASVLTGCEWVKEDLEPCPDPQLELRFVYTYNMERANAFPSQVDCLTVYFFNEEGELIKTETVSDATLLSDEDWRMRPELAPGRYHVVAYGGMECENASFYRVGNFPEGSHYTNLRVQLDPNCLTDPDRLRLHNHYYGSLDFTVDPKVDTKATVEMMRNTNSIQIALQNEYTNQPIDHKDFIFEITDDNNDFNHDNSLNPTGQIMYQPWKKENRSTFTTLPGEFENKDDYFNIAVAQFTTSRLMVPDKVTKPTSTKLTIRKASDKSVVLSVPLISYMLMFKHDNTGAGLDDMYDQEYLDRENTWNFVFFLKDGLWLDTHIIINDWEVRMNGADL